MPEIIVAAKNTQVRDSILQKISYERIGIELDKMFGGKNPEKSVAQL